MEATLKNIISFAITADEDVQQDFISITFSASETGSDPNTVQELLAVRLKDALDIANSVQVEGEVDVRSGSFQINPTYDPTGAINGYQGRTIIIVSGIDIKTITALTGKIRSMNVDGVQQSVSAARRKEVEQCLALKAIQNWRDKSKAYATAFGSGSFTLINADIGINSRAPIYRMAALESKADGGQISTEPGKETITASVSGSIQLSL